MARAHSPVMVVQFIREWIGCALVDAERMIGSTPYVLKRNLSLDKEADRWRRRFEKAGATITLETPE